MGSRLHFLNVGQGDCIVIEHASGRLTVNDICSGNKKQKSETALFEKSLRVSGNFQMCKKATNPNDYLASLGANSVFRFILSHPDMDHMDGLDRLATDFPISNFWDSGARKEKPDFDGSSHYLEIDWDRYVGIRDGGEGTTVVTPKAGSRFSLANQNEEGEGGGDGLHVLAPDKALVALANQTGNFNDASYVLQYRSIGGTVILPGDAHDKSWEVALENYSPPEGGCSLLIAPHHGRGSDRSFEFLDVLKPKLTLFGCARSEYLAYDQWRRRNLTYITNNQAGNIVAEIESGGMDIYIENIKFAESMGVDTSQQNNLGYYFIGSLPNAQ